MVEHLIDRRTTVGGAGIGGQLRGFVKQGAAFRQALLATVVACLVIGTGSRVKAGGRHAPRPAPRPQQFQQHFQPPFWQHPEFVPDFTPPPPPRPRPDSRPRNNSRPSHNLQTHPDHRIHSPSHSNKPVNPDGKSLKPDAQVVKMHVQKAQTEHHLVMRRHHRHLAPWVVGVYPNAPYSLGWYVDQVLSGNTIRVINPAGQPQIVQLHGVAAPVAGQAFFSESTERLKTEIEHQTVYVVNTFDHLDGSFTGKVFLGSEYVNRTQISEGMACYDAEQGIDVDLAEAEIESQESGRGIWGNPDLVSEMAYAD